MVKMCEFPGNDRISFDEIPKSKRLCEYAGFHHCTLHNEPLKKTLDGWRLCSVSCTSPKYKKDERRNND